MIHFQHALPELTVVMRSVRFERLAMLTKSHRFHITATLLLYREQLRQRLPQPNVLVLLSLSRSSLSRPSHVHDIRRRMSRHRNGKRVTQHEHPKEHMHDDILEPESIPLSLSPYHRSPRSHPRTTPSHESPQTESTNRKTTRTDLLRTCVSCVNVCRGNRSRFRRTYLYFHVSISTSIVDFFK